MTLQSAFQTNFLGLKISSRPSRGAKRSQIRPRAESLPRQQSRCKLIPECSSSNSLSGQTLFTRRCALQLASIAASSTLLTEFAVAEGEYSKYNGPNSLGFSFSYPSSWSVKKKPIKTHLSEVIVTSDKESSTTAGLTVDSVKIDAIDKFGTPEAVGEKVVGVETKKESVNSAKVLDAKLESNNGLTYYILDYVVDSSRGVKHYLAKATITGGQLYVFTAQAKTDVYNSETEQTLKKMLDSFTVAKQYL